VLNLETGVEIKSFKAHSCIVTSIAITNDGNKIVSAGWDDYIKV